MIRLIVQLGDPVLRARAAEIDALSIADPSISTLITEMRETLAQAGGVGLAAPQVGESVRLFVAGSFPTERDPDRPLVATSAFINPRIIRSSVEMDEGWEGCLSFLQFRVRVARHREIELESLDQDGRPVVTKAKGFFARVLQHEIDHLDGILTLDRSRAPEDVESLPPVPSTNQTS